MEAAGLQDVQSESPDDEEVEKQFAQIAKILDEEVGTPARDAYLLNRFGLTYAEISRQLSITPRHVERDVANALTVLTLKRR